MTELIAGLKMNGGVWKYIAICALSALGGLITGQFMPNRNVVTNDQMDAKLVPLIAAQSAQYLEIESMRDSVNDLKGQLRAQKLLTGN